MNNIEIKNPEVHIDGYSNKLFYIFADKVFKTGNNQTEKEQLKVEINKSILNIEEKNMLLGYL